MDALVREIKDIRGVEAVVAFTSEGKVTAAAPLSTQEAESVGWARSCLLALDEAEEADLLFANARLYVRRLGSVYLIIKMRPDTAVAMVRMAISVAG